MLNNKKLWQAPEVTANKYRFYIEVTQPTGNTLAWGKCGDFWTLIIESVLLLRYKIESMVLRIRSKIKFLKITHIIYGKIYLKFPLHFAK